MNMHTKAVAETNLANTALTNPNPVNPTSSARILTALNDAVEKLEAVERAKSEPIAIIGMGCRFPGGVDSPQAFWRLLCDGVDAIAEIPGDRWDVDAYYDANPDTPGKSYVRQGGFLHDLAGFDAHFFGISPREALALDPQQRLLLEVAWEALENAGQSRQRLRGSQTGVFVGITLNDYANRLTHATDLANLDAYFATGNTSNAAAGRLSYWLGLHGPCLAIDTACSSSLVAVHLACQSLRQRESNMALAAGVNALTTPEIQVEMEQAQMVAP